MNRRSFLSGAALAGTGATLGSAQTASGLEPESKRRIEKATVAAMALQRRDWEQGILAQAMLEANDRERVILLTKGAIVQRENDGRLGVVVSGGPTDPAMGGEAYARAAAWTKDPQIQQAVQGMLDWIRNIAPRSSDGILYHVFEGPEMWSDGFNGAPPFLAAMGQYDEAFAQIEGFRKRLWNPEKKLLSHIWDEGKQQLKSADFWGGGNGWAAAGVARVVRQFPPERRKERERLAEFVREIVDGCLAHQRSDGLFHDVVDRPTTFVETNLAQMLAYAVYEGVAGGWLAKSYLARANGLRDAARKKMDEFGYVQGVCGAPNFDHSGISTEGQAFCIMMEAAGSKAGVTGE
ncbi:MAG TPA: glycoside hydrolase family 88 protein [Candidatus Limnocylindrales bacterium]|nr:glycoside hydrolase family 88 protein [Candidatus Limnocylindrales bacterium]